MIKTFHQKEREMILTLALSRAGEIDSQMAPLDREASTKAITVQR